MDELEHGATAWCTWPKWPVTRIKKC